MSLRWIGLLSALTPGSRPRFGVVLRIFFISTFVGNFVPSVAADMYRAYALARHDVRLSESAASVLMDRVLGVLSMVLVGAAALLAARDLVAQPGIVAGSRSHPQRARPPPRCLQRAHRRGGHQACERPCRWRPCIVIAVAMTDAVRRYSPHRGRSCASCSCPSSSNHPCPPAWCLGAPSHGLRWACTSCSSRSSCCNAAADYDPGIGDGAVCVRASVRPGPVRRRRPSSPCPSCSCARHRRQPAWRPALRVWKPSRENGHMRGLAALLAASTMLLCWICWNGSAMALSGDLRAGDCPRAAARFRPVRPDRARAGLPVVSSATA